MNMSVPFDTLDATRRLRDAGFDEKQAETVVRILSDTQSNLVTREHLDTKLEQLEWSLNSELKQLGLSMTIKMGSMLLAMSALILAGLKHMLS